MKFTLHHLRSFLVIGLMSVAAVTGFSQQLSEEPAGGMDESTDSRETMMLPPSKGLLPDALDFTPLNSYYSSWDTLFVRRYSDPLPVISDSLFLPLKQEGLSEFVFPTKGQLLSPFGYRGRRVHSGVDIKLNLFDTVSCAFDGVVRMARYYSGYGNCVVVRHFNGLETLYAHLSRIKVKVGQPLCAGDLIGLGGSTGRATCNHLHFETRFRGQAFNPKQLIDFDNFSLLKDTLVITGKTFGRSRDYLPQENNLLASTDTKAGTGSEKAVYKKHNSAKKYHTVKKGDTLSAISRKYGTNVKQLCKLNGIKPSKTLQLGTKLRVR